MCNLSDNIEGEHYNNKHKIGQSQSTSSCCCATTTNISTHSQVEDDTSLNNNNGADRITAHAQNQHVHQQRVCRATQPPSSSHQQQNRRASSSSPHNHHNHGHNHAHHNGGQGEGGGGRGEEHHHQCRSNRRSDILSASYRKLEDAPCYFYFAHFLCKFIKIWAFISEFYAKI